MPLFDFLRTFSQNAQQSKKKVKAQRRTSSALGYETLEDRQVLSASFAFDAATSLFSIDGFDRTDSGLTIDQTNVSINGGGIQDAYVFTLGSGTFTNNGGIPAANFEVDGNRLSVGTSFFGGAANANVSIDGSTDSFPVALTQANITNDIEFNSLAVSNFRNFARSIELSLVGDVTLSDLTIGDEVLSTELSVRTNGSIDVDGDLTATNNGEIDLTSTDDINIFGLVQTANGDINIETGQDLVLATSIATEESSLNTSAVSSQTVFPPTLTPQGLTPQSLSPQTEVGIMSSSGDATFNVGGDAITVGDAILSGDATLGAPIVLEAGDLEVNAARDIIVGSIQARTVSLNAGDDIQDVLLNDGQFVSARNLNIVAAGRDVGINRTTDGVRLDTSVDNLSVDLPGTGGVIIREAGDITLTSIQMGGESFGSIGDLDVISEGSIQAEFIEKLSGGDVRLTAADDITITNLTTVRANVNLVAGDDVVSAAEAAPIRADRLTVRASNSNNDGVADGIILSTEVLTLDVVLENTVNSGVISVAEQSFVFVETAINQVGSISITSGVDPDLSDDGANLVAGLVFSRGSTATNAIELIAEGNNSDVVVNRVLVSGQLGGVVLTADDDIRPFELNGFESRVLADGLVLRANNNGDIGFDGIFLSQTRVRSLDAAVFGSDQSQIFINNNGAVNVTNLSVPVGSISFTNSNGNLNVAQAIVRNGNGGGSIFLKSEGIGSDIRVGNVFARNTTGVFLNAADDIFDSSFLDDIFIDADFVDAFSNNNFDDDDLNGIFISGDIDDISQQASNGGEFFFADRS